MFEKVKSFIPARKQEKAHIIKNVLDRGEHLWIHENSYVKAHMLDFLERLPLKVVTDLFVNKDTIFARSSGKFACAVSGNHQNIIIVFPELYTLLTKTYDGWAKAILAHEVGHIVLEHTKNMADPMEAQVDADQFACDMGYLEELESFLHERPESVEKRVRLSFITSYYFANN